jgi:hypothetical protein
MLFFKKDLGYMKCLHAFLQVCLADPLCDLSEKAIALVQDYRDFDKDSFVDFRKLMRAYFKQSLVDAAFKGVKRLKKPDDYQYVIPKLEVYVAKLHLFIVGGNAQKAKRMASFLANFPAAYFKNDSEAMQNILYYEPLRFLE